MPKFEILGLISLSSKTLLALRSLCIILNLESWCRYWSPRAIPHIMWKRLDQSNNLPFVWSGKYKVQVNHIYPYFNQNLEYFYVLRNIDHIITPTSRIRLRDPNQKWRGLGLCWACIHKPAVSLLVECNNQEVLQDFGVEAWKFVLLHFWIHSILVQDSLEAFWQQFLVHPLVYPEFSFADC